MIVLKETAFDGALIVVVTLLAIAANLPEEFALRYSINQDYLLLGLVAVLMFSLLRYVRFGLILTTTILIVGANLPEQLAREWNLDPGIMLFALCVMVGIAGINRIFEFMPDKTEQDRRYASAEGTKALYRAISRGKVATVDRLIHSGVNVNAKTISGATPLMLAAHLGYTDIAQMLMAAGADIFARDKYGNSALNIAQRKGFTRIVRLVENEIANPRRSPQGMRRAA